MQMKIRIEIVVSEIVAPDNKVYQSLKRIDSLKNLHNLKIKISIHIVYHLYLIHLYLIIRSFILHSFVIAIFLSQYNSNCICMFNFFC